MKIRTIPAILFLAALLLGTGCIQSAVPSAPGQSPAAATTAAAQAGYTDVSPDQAKDLIATEKDLIIIDVSPYYASGHLPGAVSIPLDTLDEKISTLDRTKTYLVYCHGDGPSIAGAKKLVDAGFPKVYRLAGNYGAWTGAGYPVET